MGEMVKAPGRDEEPDMDMMMLEGWCPEREDKTHCVCWWDGEKCCGCQHQGEEI